MAKPILTRLTEQLQAKGYGKGAAVAIATKTLQKSGSLKKGTQEMTERGRDRSRMGAAGRAKDRSARANGGKPSDYVYSKKTNRATKEDR